MKIKIGYLISYDYKLFLTSVKHVYEHVDRVYLAIDRNCKTWSGNKFEIEDSFYEEVKRYDSDNKIEFYYDDFYVPGLTPIQCDIRERNMLLKKMGRGWKLQLDADEYLYDFGAVKNFLNRHWFLNVFPKLTPVVFQGVLTTLYKELSDGFLYIDNNERFSFITNCKSYEGVRTNHSVSNHVMKAKVIHQSWARSDEELFFKISNWGHRDDFDGQSYFEFWKSLNSTNYKSFKNIHPMRADLWNELHFMKVNSIDEFIKDYGKKHPQELVNVDFLILIKAFLRRIQKKIIGNKNSK